VSDQAAERREVYYSGRVQGVGFRYTVRSLAARFRVTGFVKNLPDGGVQLVAEGPPEEIAGLLAAVREALGRYIADARETSGEATGRFRGFDIRF
jgi:acylphosphatase